jgi:hypothetical protein
VGLFCVYDLRGHVIEKIISTAREAQWWSDVGATINSACHNEISVLITWGE